MMGLSSSDTAETIGREASVSDERRRSGRPLRLLQVNTRDIGGGAARVAWDLFDAYRQRGHSSWLAVGFKGSDDPDVLPIADRSLAVCSMAVGIGPHPRRGEAFATGLGLALKSLRKCFARPTPVCMINPNSANRPDVTDNRSGEAFANISESPELTDSANASPLQAWITEANHALFSRCRNADTSRDETALLGRMARTLGDPGGALDYHLGRENFRYPATAGLLSLCGQQPDILHCHNLHGYYFDLRALPSLSRRAPVVLTLHDAWLLAGHCAHSFDCERWKSGCGHCPDLERYPAIRRDATAHNWRRKRDIYAQSRLNLATPSRWLMRKVEESMLAPAIAEARVIPNGVNLALFHPQARSVSRSALGVPHDAGVVLFAADGIRENEWKDFKTMKEAIARSASALQGKPILFLALGEDSLPERIGQSEIRFIPYQADPATVALYYQAADVYLHAARADTFPTTVLEALACGTPVVATAVGGIPDQIEDGATGFLAPAGDAGGLACHLFRVLSDGDLRERLSQRAAEAARRRFDLHRQVDAYLEWYYELVDRHTEADVLRSRGFGRSVAARPAKASTPDERNHRSGTTAKARARCEGG